MTYYYLVGRSEAVHYSRINSDDRSNGSTIREIIHFVRQSIGMNACSMRDIYNHHCRCQQYRKGEVGFCEGCGHPWTYHAKY